MTDLHDSIEALRAKLGKRVVIVGHHYQEEDVIRHVDLRGDSLELARRTAALDCGHIVFCGVYFMAESAALLAKPGQKVHLPEPSAECSMALMSPAERMRKVMEKLSAGGRKIVPLAYVNSTLGVKAVVGEYGGSVCTSANAQKMLSWALEQGDAVLFVPDRNLGANTADTLGIPESDRLRLSIRDDGANIDEAAAATARLLLWPGHCTIHTHFNLHQIARHRAEHPTARIVVHPECTPEVVKASDAAGSTSFIIRYAREAEDGAVIVIGTEVNLVERLAREHAGRITILPLAESACPHMAQTTEERLGATLRAIDGGSDEFLVRVPPELADNARNSLETMLRVCA